MRELACQRCQTFTRFLSVRFLASTGVPDFVLRENTSGSKSLSETPRNRSANFVEIPWIAHDGLSRPSIEELMSEYLTRPFSSLTRA